MSTPNGNAKLIPVVGVLVTIVMVTGSVGIWAGTTGSDLKNHKEQAAHPEADKRLREVEGKVQVIESELQHLKRGQDQIKEGQQRIENLLRPRAERRQ